MNSVHLVVNVFETVNMVLWWGWGGRSRQVRYSTAAEHMATASLLFSIPTSSIVFPPSRSTITFCLYPALVSYSSAGRRCVLFALLYFVVVLCSVRELCLDLVVKDPQVIIYTVLTNVHALVSCCIFRNVVFSLNTF